MIGQTLNHYEVIEKLGEGGMGNVYLAEDTRLNRRVALKVLRAEMAQDAERIDRFEREAKAVAALNHPNIVTIYSVEEAGEVRFLTMELVDGKTLDDLIPFGGLELAEFFEIATPLANAVAAAHRKGITHRDIKPANVMVNSEGIVKLLDLGLAKLRPPEDGDDPSVTKHQTLTRDDRVLGTVPYMAPEQLASKPTDHRVDLFSLGVVLYQMLTGVRPFQGSSSAELISAILRDSPAPLTEIKRSLPTHLARLVQKCLEKDPDQRLATAAALATELESLARLHERGELTVTAPPAATPTTATRKNQWLLGIGVVLTATIITSSLISLTRPEAPEPIAVVETTPRLPSLAVLPVTELGIGGPPGFAQGLTDEMSTTLTRLEDLAVVSAAGAPLDLSRRRLGESLGADYLLQGSIRWAPGDDGVARARTTFELIRAEDERHLWSQSYEREIADLFADQVDLAAEVRQQVALQLGLELPPPSDGLDPANAAEPSDSTTEVAEETSPPTPTPPRAAAQAGQGRTTPATEMSAAPQPAAVEVGLEMTSSVSTGVLTIYADAIEIYRHPFQFVARKKGLLGRVGLKRKVSGEFSDTFQVPPGTERLRLYVALSEQPARQLVFVPTLRGDGSDRLVVGIDDSGVIEAQLQ